MKIGIVDVDAQSRRKNRYGGKPRRYLVQAQPYRDPYGQNSPPQWQKDMAGWANNKSIFNATGFADFEPRKGFKCSSYLEQYGIT